MWVGDFPVDDGYDDVIAYEDLMVRESVAVGDVLLPEPGRKTLEMTLAALPLEAAEGATSPLAPLLLRVVAEAIVPMVLWNHVFLLASRSLVVVAS